MNLLNLCDDLHYQINKEIQKTENFYLRVHKDKFKKVFEDIENYNYYLNDLELYILIDKPILYAYYLQEVGWWIDDINADITGENWITNYYYSGLPLLEQLL
tara:strand:+ start:171 stop:476 length:306 start_codon:yes stop_codon:yes gene_type:complete